MAEEEKDYAVDEYDTEKEKKKDLDPTKFWTEDACNKFVDTMEDEIIARTKHIDSFADQGAEISQILSKLLDISQDKLAASKRPKYKYWTNCMIFDKRSIYRKHMKFFWEKTYDRMISVKVNTERLHIILIAHCVYYG
eukprot:69041_1